MTARIVAWVLVALLGVAAAWTCAHRPAGGDRRAGRAAAACREKPAPKPAPATAPVLSEKPAPSSMAAAAPPQLEAGPDAGAAAVPPTETPRVSPASVADVLAWDQARLTAELPALWRVFTAVEREGLMAALHDAMHAGLLVALDLGARDEEAGVRRAAEVIVSGIAVDDFRGDPERYEEWKGRIQGLTLEEVVAASARTGLERLTRLASRPRHPEPESVVEHRLEFGRLEWGLAQAMEHPATRRAVQEAGVLGQLEDWITRGNETKAETAMYFVGVLDPGEEWLERVVVPLIQEPGDGDRRLAAIRAAAVPWAVDYLIPCLRDPNDTVVAVAAESLATSRVRRAAPCLIDALRYHQSRTDGLPYRLRRALEMLSGVPPDSSRTNAWWFQWWERNRSRFE